MDLEAKTEAFLQKVRKDPEAGHLELLAIDPEESGLAAFYRTFHAWKEGDDNKKAVDAALRYVASKADDKQYLMSLAEAVYEQPAALESVTEVKKGPESPAAGRHRGGKPINS